MERCKPWLARLSQWPIRQEFNHPWQAHELQSWVIDLSGSGCPKCNQSHLENFIENILKENNIDYVSQYKNKEIIGNKSIDFYLPQYNIAIECQGAQHFIPVDFFGGKNALNETIQRDIAKFNSLTKNKIKVIYILEKKNKKYIDNPIFNKIYNKNVFFQENLKNNIKNMLS